MALKYNDDGMPEIFKKVYKYFEDDQRIWDKVNELVMFQMLDSRYIKIAKMVQKKIDRNEIIGEILDTHQIYQDQIMKSYKREKKIQVKTIEELQEKYKNGIINQEKKEEIVVKEKKKETKESINSRQKSFRARRTQEKTKKVSFYLSEEKKAKMDALRLEKGITQEKLIEEMINSYFKKLKIT